MKNGVAVIVAAGNDNVSNSAVIDLEVGDTVWVQMSHLFKAMLVGIASEPEHGLGDFYHTTFTGYIIDTVYDACWLLSSSWRRKEMNRRSRMDSVFRTL